MTADVPASQEQSLVFQLPAELRLVIYEMVLILPFGYCRRRAGDDRHWMPYVPDQEKKVTIVDPTYSNPAFQRNTARRSVLEILQTCKRVLEEAQDIFYQRNHVRVLMTDESQRRDASMLERRLYLCPHINAQPIPESGLPFLTLIEPARKNAIQDLTIVMHDANPRSLTLLAEAVRNLSGLRTLSIEVGGGSHDCFPPKEIRFPELCRAAARSRSLRDISFVIVIPTWMFRYSARPWAKWQHRVRFMQARIDALVGGSERRPGGARTISVHLNRGWESEAAVVRGNGPV
ncbi:hypothetical protein LTR56_014385 [Elasticomyces elasticus]|nr:hypothetical protein LTR22_023901 [Elasticomyces elasticus]KAK3636009.1 hypothetical protein LTR56_014385 [Elasticomyces elasticus]KAK4916652.1 hypothetical protein LTR49_015350 [Elasticomyces elasticus]KAK5754926.1 hypothetical protein LTS12_014959 [Elasticomyces elasticus]